jgi:hypothetical protein
MLETVAIIATVATGLLSSLGTVKGLKTEQKLKISHFFTTIADTIDTAVTKFKANEIPHGACEEMRRYAIELPIVLGGHIDEYKLQTYSEELYRAHDIEQLYMSVQKNPDSLVELEKAASAFRVASNIIKL